MDKKDISLLLKERHQLEDSYSDMKKESTALDELIDNNQSVKAQQIEGNLREEGELLHSRYSNEILNINNKILDNYNQINSVLFSRQESLKEKIRKTKKDLQNISEQIIKQKKEEDNDGKDETR
ncbi:hypothetical protein ACWCL1_06465 [Ligilactobacillus sp. LYQ135]